VDEVEVQVVEAEVAERPPAGRDDVLRRVRVVPELGGHPEVLAPDAAVEGGPERAPDLRLVAVDRGAIDVPVAGRERAEHRGPHLVG
jgi:hypothetical protein